VDIAFTIIRLVLGAAIAAHGLQKLGFFGGPGIAGTTGFMHYLGYKPAKLFALSAAGSEILGGLITIVGNFYEPLAAFGPALIVMVMVVAILTVHVSNGFFQSGNPNGPGYELNVMYIVTAAASAYHGASDARFVTIVLVVGVVLGLVNASIRQKQPASAN
jgi:putative oxidoreductase